MAAHGRLVSDRIAGVDHGLSRKIDNVSPVQRRFRRGSFDRKNNHLAIGRRIGEALDLDAWRVGGEFVQLGGVARAMATTWSCLRKSAANVWAATPDPKTPIVMSAFGSLD